MFAGLVAWASRSVVIYRWPVPTAFLFAMVSVTNPPPYLIPELHGDVQRTVFAVAAFAMLTVAVVPRYVWVRNLGAFASTSACTWRVATLIVNPGPYDVTEVAAFATVWVAVGVLVVQMMVLTWPTVSLNGWGRR